MLKSRSNQLTHFNRREKLSGVDTAEDVGGMDATVELTGRYLQRAEEVSTHKPAASN